MKTLSQRMLNSGWLLHKQEKNAWSFQSPLGFSTTWTPPPGLPPVPPEDLLREIEAVEQAIAEGKISRFLGAAARTQPPVPPEGSPTALHLAREHLAKNHAVLRFRTQPDPAGDQALLRSGAWRVETWLPPWPPPRTCHLSGFTVFTCEHLLDSLPRLDRRHLFHTIQALTPAPEGVVYFTVIQMSALPREWLKMPFEDGYQIPYGHNQCFVKPYSESMLQRELSGALSGYVRRAWIHHHEITFTWRPHV